MKNIFFAPANGRLANMREYEAKKIVVGNNQAVAVMIVFVTLRTRLSQ